MSKFIDLLSSDQQKLQLRRQLDEAARIAIEVSLKVQPQEQVLIISNPEDDASFIAGALYDASLNAGGRPVLLFQQSKTQLDFAEPAVLSAFNARPQVVISMSSEKLGKDPQGIANPFYTKGKNTIIFFIFIFTEKKAAGASGLPPPPLILLSGQCLSIMMNCRGNAPP